MQAVVTPQSINDTASKATGTAGRLLEGHAASTGKGPLNALHPSSSFSFVPADSEEPRCEEPNVKNQGSRPVLVQGGLAGWQGLPFEETPRGPRGLPRVSLIDWGVSTGIPAPGSDLPVHLPI